MLKGAPSPAQASEQLGRGWKTTCWDAIGVFALAGVELFGFFLSNLRTFSKNLPCGVPNTQL